MGRVARCRTGRAFQRKQDKSIFLGRTEKQRNHATRTPVRGEQSWHDEEKESHQPPTGWFEPWSLARYAPPDTSRPGRIWRDVWKLLREWLDGTGFGNRLIITISGTVQQWQNSGMVFAANLLDIFKLLLKSLGCPTLATKVGLWFSLGGLVRID